MNDVQKYIAVLEVLTPRQRTHFLKTLNKTQMGVLQIAFFNLATNNQTLSTKEIAVLKRYKRQIEIIASKQHKLGEKRKVITQRGGFLPAVVPVLASLLGSFLTR